MTLNTSMKNEPSTTNLALIDAVRDALTQYTPTRIWAQRIDVQAQAGTVTLSGVTRNRSAKETADRLVRRIPGISKLKNQIVVDDEVEVAVAQALACDARTCDSWPGILVGVVFGVAYLKGPVASNEIKKAAGEVVGKIPGVQNVSNELSIAATKKNG